MRQRVYFKIVKLAVTETLVQVGFERSSEDALNVMADIFCFHLESNFRRMKAMQYLRFGAYKVPLSLFTYAKSIHIGSYAYGETMAFLACQSALSLHLREKFKVDGDNLLQMLKVLPPRRIKLEVFNKQHRVSLSQAKSDVTESKDIEIDDFMTAFLEKALDEEGCAQPDYVGNTDLSSELVRMGGQPMLVLDEDTYEKLLVFKRQNFFNHFARDMGFVSDVTEDLTLLGKKVVEKEGLDDR